MVLITVLWGLAGGVVLQALLLLQRWTGSASAALLLLPAPIAVLLMLLRSLWPGKELRRRQQEQLDALEKKEDTFPSSREERRWQIYRDHRAPRWHLPVLMLLIALEAALKVAAYAGVLWVLQRTSLLRGVRLLWFPDIAAPDVGYSTTAVVLLWNWQWLLSGALSLRERKGSVGASLLVLGVVLGGALLTRWVPVGLVLFYLSGNVLRPLLLFLYAVLLLAFRRLVRRNAHRPPQLP